MRRHDNDSLLLALALALEQEHKGRTGHSHESYDWHSWCLICSSLRTVFGELEERNAEAMLQDLDATEADLCPDCGAVGCQIPRPHTVQP